MGSDSQTASLLDVQVVGVVLALQLSPLGLLVVNDVPEDTLRSTALLLAALAALGAEGIGKDS